MAKIVSLIVALVIFGAWMNIVGNPHVVETAIGLVISIVAGFWIYRVLSKNKSSN